MPATWGGETAIGVEALTHRYSSRASGTGVALDALSLTIAHGEIFGLLGPNGSGKSTLFRILTGLLRPTSGTANILGNDVLHDTALVRGVIGVTFQNPSVDRRLTVEENLVHQGHLYGLRGGRLRERVAELASRLGIDGRMRDLVEHLSGGLQRRVELAKGLLHEPGVLLLDEPSTGLDPGARREFFDYMKKLQEDRRLTILLTTHMLDEAERCDRIAILDEGHIVALGTPADLRHEIGGDVISVATENPQGLRGQVRNRFGLEARVVDGLLRIERSGGHAFVPQLVEAFPGQIDTVTVSRPTLEDVFLHRTGRPFWVEKGR